MPTSLGTTVLRTIVYAMTQTIVRDSIYHLTADSRRQYYQQRQSSYQPPQVKRKKRYYSSSVAPSLNWLPASEENLPWVKPDRLSPSGNLTKDLTERQRRRRQKMLN